MQDQSPQNQDAIIINEAQLILAEKRTSLAAMRTGIAVFALPLSVLSLLIATSRFYEVAGVMHLLIPLIVINICLIALGGYLIIRAIFKIHHYDHLLTLLKSKHSAIAEFID